MSRHLKSCYYADGYHLEVSSINILIFKSEQSISYNSASAPSENFDKTAHPCSLIRVFTGHRDSVKVYPPKP